MPRTKQVRKKSSMTTKLKKSIIAPSRSGSDSVENASLTELLSQEYDSKKSFLEEFEKYYNKKIEDHNRGYERACEEIKKMIKNLKENLPPQLRNKYINDKASEDSEDGSKNQEIKDVDVGGSIVRSSRSRKRSVTPDAYLFKRPKSPSMIRIRQSSRKRSVSASSASSSRFKTPLLSSRKISPNLVITPKMNCSTPFAMMRRPQVGELAMSMSGSPLMVAAIPSDDIPTVNVPLQDGRVFSIIPEPGCPPPDFPDMDETTKQYLKTLKAHLEIIAPNSP